jgi:transcriptional regulator with XRE-family HTH domain
VDLLLTERGWSKREVERRLAERMGVAAKTGRMTRILTGAGHPSYVEAIEVARALDVRDEWLWLGEEPRDPDMPERVVRALEASGLHFKSDALDPPDR